MYDKNKKANWLMVSYNTDCDEFGYDRLGFCTYEEAVKEASETISFVKDELEENGESIDGCYYPTLNRDYGSITCSDFHIDFDIIALENFIQNNN